MNANCCLLVIDVQNALFSDLEHKLYKENEVLMNISKLIDHARGKGVSIVYVQHTEKDGAFKRGTDSWRVHEHIAPCDSDVIVEKTSWDGFYKTQLDDVLKSMGIKTLIIAGMQTEFCLDTTLRRAYSMGYQSIIAEDAHSTFDNAIITGKQIVSHHNQIWNGRFGTLRRTAEIQF